MVSVAELGEAVDDTSGFVAKGSVLTGPVLAARVMGSVAAVVAVLSPPEQAALSDTNAMSNQGAIRECILMARACASTVAERWQSVPP